LNLGQLTFIARIIIIQTKVKLPMTKLNTLKEMLLPLIRKHAQLKLAAPIKLASGKMSDQYFDGRKITLHPEGMTLCARAILEMIDPTKFDAIGGPTLGADPIATAVSLVAYLEKKVTLPAFIVRKEVKTHGLGQQIEGVELKPGMNILMVEDVITSGKSVKKAIDVVEKTGAKVTQVICLVDRNEGGEAALAPHQMSALFKKDDIS
jgi:orotate phosphoribosyltransferase